MSMREHKYRYWYGGKMIEVGQIEFFTDGQITVNGELVGGELLEWTGFLDKNGVEIYEGDIVASSWIEKSGKKLNNFSVVEWGDEISDDWGNMVVGYNKDFENKEIIGNIYENPELLTGNIKDEEACTP